LEPLFGLFTGVEIKLAAPQKFTVRLVEYTITIKGQPTEKWKVHTAVNNNPVLDGY